MSQPSTIDELLGNEEVPVRRWDLVRAFFGRNVYLGERYVINARRLLRRSDSDLKISKAIVDFLMKEHLGQSLLEPQEFTGNGDKEGS